MINTCQHATVSLYAAFEMIYLLAVVSVASLLFPLLAALTKWNLVGHSRREEFLLGFLFRFVWGFLFFLVWFVFGVFLFVGFWGVFWFGFLGFFCLFSFFVLFCLLGFFKGLAGAGHKFLCWNPLMMTKG